MPMADSSANSITVFIFFFFFGFPLLSLSLPFFVLTVMTSVATGEMYAIADATPSSNRPGVWNRPDAGAPASGEVSLDLELLRSGIHKAGPPAVSRSVVDGDAGCDLGAAGVAGSACDMLGTSGSIDCFSDESDDAAEWSKATIPPLDGSSSGVS